MENNVIIDLKNISVAFDGEQILKNINLYIRDGEFITFLGPSGCGKTTTLRIIAGFLEPDEGDVIFDGKKINGVPPHKRKVNTIFQRYALFPHLNVAENIAFGLKLKKMPKDKIEKKVSEMLSLVNLKGFEHRNINSLSGGQQQRVAIARALVNNPSILLCDEHTGNLDPENSWEIMKILEEANRRGTTVVVVTHNHDIVEKMRKRVIKMDSGNIVEDAEKGGYLYED